jgi:CMD domain protein
MEMEPYGSACRRQASAARCGRVRRSRGGAARVRVLQPQQGPLSAEDKAGPVHRIAAPTRAALGARLAAAFEHTHMLVFHPRDSAPPYLQALLDAGWSTTGIVVISQLVAFLSYQIRVVAGLRVLNARPA